MPFGIGSKGSSDFSRWDDDGSNYYYANCTGDHYADELPYDELGELPYELFAADAAIDIFRPFLLRQILAVNPRIVVTLGRVATRALLRTPLALGEVSGRLHILRLNGREFAVVPTFLPETLSYFPNKVREICEDLKLLRDFLASQIPAAMFKSGRESGSGSDNEASIATSLWDELVGRLETIAEELSGSIRAGGVFQDLADRLERIAEKTLKLERQDGTEGKPGKRNVSHRITVPGPAKSLDKHSTDEPSEPIDVMAALKKSIALAQRGESEPTTLERRRPDPITSNEWISVPANDSLQRIVADVRTYMSDTPTTYGLGKSDAELIVIDQSPGLEEIQQGMPFVGRAGEIVAKMLTAIGLSRDACFLTYAIKCREVDRGNWDDYWEALEESEEYPDERGSPDEELFRPYLLREILSVGPRVILSFGGLATRALLRTEESISELRGTVHMLRLNGREFEVVPTFRPSILLHLPHKKEESWEDLKLVRDRLASHRLQGQ